MVARFALLQVVTLALALMAQAAPVVRSFGDPAVELSTSAEEARATKPSRGMEPWKGGPGAAAGAAALTERFEHLVNSDAPARSEGAERPAAPGPPGVPPPQAPPQPAPQGQGPQVHAPTPQYPQAPRPRVVQPVPAQRPQGPSSPSARGLLQGEDMETTPEGFQAREDLGAAAEASKIPFKPVGLGLVGGAALDHVLSSLPTPYFHSQPNFRSLDSNDNVVAAGIKRSEPGGWPWRWILDGPPEGLALEKMLIG
ncbi:hypothetical protein A4X13_0g6443 [Tilletia indica]|uniref:Uncharacterized protein n=1 Tax=Tilletia indica TaxID=43049 RepID=A0A177TKQ7_9BASI|nr:hypothetical protein A4X13_0g6443 [Tilletia indica]